MNATLKPSAYTLRPYQQEAVEQTLRHFRKSRDPAVLVLPTGAGKSLVIAELARIARGRVLVLTHVKELVEQNYSKYTSLGLPAGIYSAGLSRKEIDEKVIFGGIQSVARAPERFFEDYSLLIIDESHRVSEENDTQYGQVIARLRRHSPQLCILGLTATPYRLDTGWTYQYSHRGVVRTEEPKLFIKCIHEVSLKEMIRNKYLTPPVQIDAPVACYDFSELRTDPEHGRFVQAEIEAILKEQKRFTPGIVQNIVDMAKDRKGVLLFTSSVRHAEEVLAYLPKDNSAMIVGDTESGTRDELLKDFKKQKIKFLVNVSVLTTGFDAPHVDVIAILRPTESVALYQQIIGRGLRLAPGKADCLILDYTGVAHDIFVPQISDKRPTEDSVPVEVPCPVCEHVNEFWGIKDDEGEVIEHFGRKCRGAIENPEDLSLIPCGYRYRFKNCVKCGQENDIAARACSRCAQVLVDDDTKLREARASKESHILQPDTMTLTKRTDAKGRERLEVRYYDLDAQYLSEVFFLNTREDAKAFYYNFVRMHSRLPVRSYHIDSVDKALAAQAGFRMPLYVIARKHEKFWRIREKIFR